MAGPKPSVQPTLRCVFTPLCWTQQHWHGYPCMRQCRDGKTAQTMPPVKCKQLGSCPKKLSFSRLFYQSPLSGTRMRRMPRAWHWHPRLNTYSAVAARSSGDCRMQRCVPALGTSGRSRCDLPEACPAHGSGPGTLADHLRWTLGGPRLAGRSAQRTCGELQAGRRHGGAPGRRRGCAAGAGGLGRGPLLLGELPPQDTGCGVGAGPPQDLTLRASAGQGSAGSQDQRAGFRPWNSK